MSAVHAANATRSLDLATLHAVSLIANRTPIVVQPTSGANTSLHDTRANPDFENRARAGTKSTSMIVNVVESEMGSLGTRRRQHLLNRVAAGGSPLLSMLFGDCVSGSDLGGDLGLELPIGILPRCSYGTAGASEMDPRSGTA